MVTLVTIGAWTSNFVYSIRTFNCLHLVYFSGFLNEWLIFNELFCEGPSALRKYALTAVRGLKNYCIICMAIVCIVLK